MNSVTFVTAISLESHSYWGQWELVMGERGCLGSPADTEAELTCNNVPSQAGHLSALLQYHLLP